MPQRTASFPGFKICDSHYPFCFWGCWLLKVLWLLAMALPQLVAASAVRWEMLLGSKWAAAPEQRLGLVSAVLLAEL